MTTKVLIFLLVQALLAWNVSASDRSQFEPSAEHPFGKPNPRAPAQLSEFAFMVGKNDCTEERRNASQGTWTSSQRSWDAHYTMNGFAIIDTGRSNTSSNGNMRIFDPETKQWVVTFFSMPTFSTGIWRGKKEGDSIVLKQPQTAPGSGIKGVSRLTFSNITKDSFEWIGEWVSDDETIVYPFWKISCESA